MGIHPFSCVQTGATSPCLIPSSNVKQCYIEWLASEPPIAKRTLSFLRRRTAVRNKFFTTGTPVFSRTQYDSVDASSRRCHRSLCAGKARRRGEHHHLA